ncbi:MAG: type II CAAX endopeptidase family protein [Polyangiaceae bacterium]
MHALGIADRSPGANPDNPPVVWHNSLVLGRRAKNRSVVALRREEPQRPHEGGLARVVVSTYLVLALIGGALAWYFSGNPLAHPRPWLNLSLFTRVSSSIALGTALAFAVVLATRFTVTRFGWARALHHELQPLARRFDRNEIWLVALLSSLGEELFFRSFLVPVVGVIGSTLIFGLLHQTRGKARWIWVAWASIVGAAFAVLYCFTGSVLGPIVAHALINGTNLQFLRSYVVTEEPDYGDAKTT